MYRIKIPVQKYKAVQLWKYVQEHHGNVVEYDDQIKVFLHSRPQTGSCGDMPFTMKVVLLANT